MLTKSRCEHCETPIEFETEEFKYGATAQCPGCGKDSRLKLGAGPRWLGTRPTVKSDPEQLIPISYVAAILIPFVGFFLGVYLILKKQHGHGVAVMAISVAGGFFGVLLLMSLVS